jgi:hypothetical protein
MPPIERGRKCRSAPSYGQAGRPRSLRRRRTTDFNSLLEALIKKHASIKGSEDVAEEFMAYRATLEAKLCWYRGIPVEIDHPLVPMELVPVRQLSQDDNVYEFLGSGWVPPPQGFLGTLSRLFSKRP